MQNTVIIVFGSTSACCIMVPRPLTPKNSVDTALGVVQNKQSKSRKHLTIGDKLKVLTELDSGKSNRSIAKLFGYDKRASMNKKGCWQVRAYIPY